MPEAIHIERLQRLDHMMVAPIKDKLIESARQMKQGRGRFVAYRAMKLVYQAHLVLAELKIRKRAAKALQVELGIPNRKSVSLMRVLVETTSPDADPKQKSRWSRALEYIALREVPATKFSNFLASHGGLAGCARLASKRDRRHVNKTGEGDWADD